MTRAEQLHWWREGYEAGLRAAEHDRQEHALAAHRIAVAEFRDRRQADADARAGALIAETIDVLARAMLGDAGELEGAA